jgi:two-component system sensor histidine kinase UhpB
MRKIAEEVGRINAENTRLLQRLVDGEKRFRSISRGVLRVQEAERGRISRELHDGLGQSLTALKVQLELLEQSVLKEGNPLAERLSELRELADRSLQEVREISHLLRPQMLDELGLVPTLRWLVRTFQKRTGIAVELTHDESNGGTTPEVATLVFRVVQEALTNVAKHARSATVEVHLRRQGERLLLTVQDHGAGFDAEQVLTSDDEDRGFGLRGMRDRVQLLRGRFAARSAPGTGTTIEVEVPLDLEAEGRG